MVIQEVLPAYGIARRLKFSDFLTGWEFLRTIKGQGNVIFCTLELVTQHLAPLEMRLLISKPGDEQRKKLVFNRF